MIRTKTLTLVLAVLAAGAAPLQGAPPSGAARAVAAPEEARLEDVAPRGEAGTAERARPVRLPVTIDLTEVKVDGEPAPLGAYLVRVHFDPESVRLVSVRGGSAKDFTTAPVHTHLERANQTGTVALTALNSREDGPTGLVQVALLAFSELVEGGRDTVRTEIVSVVTPLLPGTRDGELNVHSIPVAK